MIEKSFEGKEGYERFEVTVRSMPPDNATPALVLEHKKRKREESFDSYDGAMSWTRKTVLAAEKSGEEIFCQINKITYLRIVSTSKHPYLKLVR